jgi:hypothetical protein
VLRMCWFVLCVLESPVQKVSEGGAAAVLLSRQCLVSTMDSAQGGFHLQGEMPKQTSWSAKLAAAASLSLSSASVEQFQ